LGQVEEAREWLAKALEIGGAELKLQALDREMIEIPFNSTSEDVPEYRLNAESGKIVLKGPPN
jgi:hypothetical protein